MQKILEAWDMSSIFMINVEYWNLSVILDSVVHDTCNSGRAVMACRLLLAIWRVLAM